MKYYCLGNRRISLIKLGTCSSNSFWDYAIPIYGKLPVTQLKMRNAFDQSEELILCKNIEDAKMLRYAKIEAHTNITPEFVRGAIAKGYPLGDYAIYEIEVDDNLNANLPFIKLADAPLEQLRNLVSQQLMYDVYLGNRTKVPNIEVYHSTRASLNPTLLACHYFSLVDGAEELDQQNTCTLI